MRTLLLVLLVTACIVQAPSVMSPSGVQGSGTLTCRQIAEQCDSQCTDPFCVRACSSRGTPDAAILHNAVVDCAQRNGCFNESCLTTRCAMEINACKGPDEPAPQQPAPPRPGDDNDDD